MYTNPRYAPNGYKVTDGKNPSQMRAKVTSRDLATHEYAMIAAKALASRYVATLTFKKRLNPRIEELADGYRVVTDDGWNHVIKVSK